MNNTGKTKISIPTETEVTAMGIKWNVRTHSTFWDFKFLKVTQKLNGQSIGRGRMNALVMIQSTQLRGGNLQVNPTFSIEGNGSKSTR